MIRRIGWTLGFLAAFAAYGEARAQFGYGYYPGGYGGYGWGGWGTGTAEGNIARGLGAYNVGAGVYNQDTAVANSINTDTVMKWNEYWYQSQVQANRRERQRLAQREKRDAAYADTLHNRLLKNPSPEDIASGNALDALLVQLSDPRIHSSALREAKDKIPGRVIRAIPFVNASEAVTISLDQLTAETGWPTVLRDPLFAEERKAYSEAIDKALKEDHEGDLTPETIAHVRNALTLLRAKLEANPPADVAGRREADNYIRTLIGMTRMLDRPDVEKIIAELDQTKETTLGHLLGFMHAFNLRFGRATTPEQRAAYETLYPALAAHRDRMMRAIKDDKGADARKDTTSSPPVDFLSEMKLHELEGKPDPKKK